MKKNVCIAILSVFLVFSLVLNGLLGLAYIGKGSKLDELQSLIEEKFIGEADPELLADAAAEAMILATGDRWSFYTPASQAQSFQEQMDNAYVGVGITIRMADDESGLLVLKVNPGGPAEEAGILPGDILVAVEGQRTAELGMDPARDLVRGPEGTTVELTILRDGQETDYQVERRSIETVVAEGRMVTDDIGVVTIQNFDTRSSEETIAAIEDLKTQGAEKIIFDVRFNPGGFVHELVATLDYLLPEGDLIRTVDYRGKTTLDTSDADYLDMPMAVLVNADSYSAAEFFAATLQEYHAAQVIGTKTSGKGYFQMTYYLHDGSSVNLSSGKYFTPSGICLQNIGIFPDVNVEADEELQMKILSETVTDQEDVQLQAAIQALQNVETQESAAPELAEVSDAA